MWQIDQRLRDYDQHFECDCDLCAHDERKRGRRIVAILVFAACVSIWAWIKA